MAENQTSRRPNVVLILCDDMGYSDIGCYGSEISTPNIDRLATAGVRFTQTYNCGRCCPTRASILTGLYPHQAGVGHMVQDIGLPGYRGFLNDRCVTVAELLGESGYRTLMTGKWHVGGHWPRIPGPEWRPGDPSKPLPVDRGFDDWYGIPGGGNYFNPSPLMRGHDFIEPEDGFYTTDAYTDRAVEMIEPAVACDEPFFLHVCYNAPHWPLHAHREDIERYRGKYRHGWDAVRTARHEQLKGMGILSDKWDISPRDEDAPPWQQVELRDWEDSRMACYAAQIDCMDRNIGRLLATLDELGVSDDTYVMFLSDNGGSAEFLAENGRKENELSTTLDGREVRIGNIPGLEPGDADTFMSYDLPWANASNSPFRKFKSWVHEGGISTPLIVQGPGVSGGRIVHEPNHVVDIVATVLDVCGVDYPGQFKGRDVTPIEGESFAALLAGQSWSRNQPIYFEHEGNRAVRDGRWKLVSAHELGRWELYDITEDRTELNDLSDAKPDEFARLGRLYDDWANRAGVLPWEQVAAERRRRHNE
ncbi:MAG: arylsulfatase [Phycisphaerae bacterium]